MEKMVLRRRIAALVLAAFLSVTGATTAMMAVSDNADAQRCPNCHDNPPGGGTPDGGTGGGTPGGGTGGGTPDGGTRK